MNEQPSHQLVPCSPDQSYFDLVIWILTFCWFLLSQGQVPLRMVYNVQVLGTFSVQSYKTAAVSDSYRQNK